MANIGKKKYDLPGTRGPAKKIYLPIFINKYRVVGLVDCGADVTIMQESLFYKIIPYEKGADNELQHSDIENIYSFSNHVIPITGKMSFRICLSHNHPGFSLNVYIIPSNAHIPELLLGKDFLEAGLADLGFQGEPNNAVPTLKFKYPTTFHSTVYNYPADEIYTCTGEYDLGPHQMESIEMYLSPAAPVVRTDWILITSCIFNKVVIIPSRTDITYDSVHKCFVGTVCVVNTTNKLQKGRVQGKMESINDYDPIIINDYSMPKLRSTLGNHPLGREILQSHMDYVGGIPTMTINSLSTATKQNVQVSDVDYADAIFASEPEYTGTANIHADIIDPAGYELPTVIFPNALEASQLYKFPTHIQPYIKDIFVDKYPEVVSLHGLDAGNLSLTLGYTQLRLRKGEVLPRAKRIFHVSPSDARHLDDIINLLIKFGFVMRSPPSPTGHHLYGMSAYLVPRAKPGCLGRLIVDFSPVNQLIESPSAVIPEINNTLQFLQGKAMYSSLDLRQAYMAMRIDEESQPLTTFLTPSGSYRFRSLPTGAAGSPALFAEVSYRMLHFEPVLDEKGKPVFESPNVVKQIPSPLEHTVSYFDDIVIASTAKPTYEETLKEHFKNVEATVKRLCFHGAKISVTKCDFSKTKILFLGWFVSHNFVIADPRRVQKVKEFAFPTNKKSVRAFLGLVNSLRKVVSMNVIEQVGVLTPLTSSKAEFKYTQKHVDAFESIKEMLTREPLFCNLIDETAEKYLWCDAATGSGVLAGVLAQRIVSKKDEKVVPVYIDLENEVHQIIYDDSLPYEPCTLYTSLPIELPKPSLRKTVPPNICKEAPLCGFTPENVVDSFFWSTLSILALYCGVLTETVATLREKAVKHLKSSILNSQLKDFVFDMNWNNYNDYLLAFKAGTAGLDKNFYLVKALATYLQRPVIIISTLKRHNYKGVFHFNETSSRPPLIYGLMERQGHEIYIPFFINKNSEFNISTLKGLLNIVAYIAKTVPEALRSKCILDLEVLAILTVLFAVQKLISNVPVKLLTDSRVLYYLFSTRVGNSSVKIRRWCLKLASDYQNVKLYFVRTSDNLADFLTREGLPPGDCEKFNLKDISIANFHHELPKLEFTLSEWIDYVDSHPEYLMINAPNPQKVKTMALQITAGLDNVKSVVTPLEILRERLSRANIIVSQKKELSKIYSSCLAGENFEYVSTENPPVKYKLINNLLMVEKEYYKIMVPNSMIGLLLSHTHLLGHSGLQRMLLDMDSYYFPKMYTYTQNFISRCYACFLSYKGNKRTKIGIYPTPCRAMQEVYCDLAENLNPVNGYAHLLIVTCPLSDFTLVIPLKSKTSAEVNQYMLYAVLQPFKIEILHTDNGAAFRSNGWMQIMSALGITVVNSASLSPRGRGAVEKKVYVVKKMLQKMLATRPTLSWQYLPFLVSKAINNTVSPKTGYRPAEMVLGAEAAGATFLDLSTLGPPHYAVKSNKLYIEQLSAEFKTMTEVATKKLMELRIVQNERVNKNRVERSFKINDIVFVLDRTYVEGNPRVLRTTLSPSPYVVLRPLFKSTLVMRIADRFTSLYNNDDLKLFHGNSPLFQQLPKEVLRALLHKFTDLMEQDFSSITKNDPLSVPSSVELFEPDVPQEQKADEDQINLFGQDSDNIFEPNPDPELTPTSEEAQNKGEVKVRAVPLNEQEFLDLPDDDGLEDDIEELLEQNGEPTEQVEDDVTSNSEDEGLDEETEQGMKLRYGRVKNATPKTVRFR